ncbi:MAG: glucose-1-phosphate cytidylyltransferase [Rhodopila sp.]|nr:glucose-1-phosphate cytidylyltransferase [Rhodopila sp.]
MKVVILAGGKGTRLAEETSVRPKPMVEVGGRPILWHIMKSYLHHGIQDFVICTGYLGHKIKEYFLNYAYQHADITIDHDGRIEVHESYAEPWSVTLVNTGEDTMTGGRLKRVRDYVKDEPYFCMTYGDGVSDVDIGSLIEFHRGHDRLATVTAVRPNARFGALEMQGSAVTAFVEKPTEEGGLINGGFFVLSPRVLDYIADDSTNWEDAPLRTLAHEGQLQAFRHEGFWQPMDTVRDRTHLERLWQTGAPWRKWK